MKYIVSPQVSYSGNIATANRIASYFSDAKVIDVDHMKYNYISSKDLIIGLHAYKVGKELIDKNISFKMSNKSILCTFDIDNPFILFEYTSYN